MGWVRQICREAGRRARQGRPAAAPVTSPTCPDPPGRYFCAIVTVTGAVILTVNGSPGASVAALRSPAITAPAPAAAPVAAPMAAPLPPPRIAPRIAPPTDSPPTFAAVSLPG